MIRFQQSQALTSHFESFWSIVCMLSPKHVLFFLVDDNEV